MGRAKLTVGQKVLDFGINIDAQKALLNGVVMSRILKFMSPKGRTKVAHTCRWARKHLVKSHVKKPVYQNLQGEGIQFTPLAIGQVVAFTDMFNKKHPMNGYYKIQKIEPKGVSIYRLTRLGYKTFPKKKHFLPFIFEKYQNPRGKLDKSLWRSEAFGQGRVDDLELTIIANDKQSFRTWWQEHCEEVFPQRQQRKNGAEDEAWSTKRRSKYVWVLPNGQKQYPPCPY